MQKKLLSTILFVAGFSWNSFSNTSKLLQIKNTSEETGHVAVYLTSADRLNTHASYTLVVQNDLKEGKFISVIESKTLLRT